MSETTPVHLGFILDGNRRWAKSRGLPTLVGHQRGYKTFLRTVEGCFERGVGFVSAYIFSTENWSRTKEEVDYLMNLALKVFTTDLKKIHKKGYRICWFGIKDRLSDKHLKAIEEAEELTKDNQKGTLCVCFNYGGKQEIVDATKKIVESGIAVENIDEKLLDKNMYHPDVPPVDMVVRTSMEQRISNFMLWRIAYAEFLFIKKHWPAFNLKDLDKVIDEYAARNRRFGS